MRKNWIAFMSFSGPIRALGWVLGCVLTTGLASFAQAQDGAGSVTPSGDETTSFEKQGPQNPGSKADKAKSQAEQNDELKAINARNNSNDAEDAVDTLSDSDEGDGVAKSPRRVGGKKATPFKKSRLTRDEAEAKADRRTLVLATGEDKVVDLDFTVNPGPGRITIGNTKVVFATLVTLPEGKRQLSFKPLSNGETNVTIRDEDGNVKVIFVVKVAGTNLLRTAGDLRTLFRDIEGIDIRIVGRKIIIDGEVLVPADFGRIYTVVTSEPYAKDVLNLTNLSPVGLQFLARKIQDDINVFAPNVKARVVNERIFLEGTVDDAGAADRAIRLANLYLPVITPAASYDNPEGPFKRISKEYAAVIQNFIVINPPAPKKADKLIRISVYFVELTKDYDKVFNFVWRPGFTSDPQIQIGRNPSGAADASGGGFSATLSSLIPKLNAATTAGYARVLKSGTVLVRSGQEAKFEEKTKIPIVTQAGQFGAVQVNDRDVGTGVVLRPTVVGQTDDIEIHAVLSQTALASNDPRNPITSGHQVDTKLYIKNNESAAVMGFSGQDVATTFNKIPGDSAATSAASQPLFNVTAGKNFVRKKNQFVVFVTPQIIENAAEGTEDLRRNFRVKVR